jgi:AraC-like DNA-binding protein
MENKLEPQFPAKGLYISPFSLVRTYDTEGVPSYVPLERNLAPTGVKLLDDFLVFLMKGNLSVKTFCENRDIDPRYFHGLVYLLTGETPDALRKMYTLNLANDLLRYTDLTLDDVAKRSGLGSNSNLSQMLKRHYRCCALRRRKVLRKKGDEGKYKL